MPEKPYIGRARQLEVNLDTNPVQIMVDELGKQRKKEAELREALNFAQLDHLTGLDGRGKFFESLEIELQKIRPLLLAKSFEDVRAKLENVNLCVTAIDVAYLNKFNEDREINPVSHVAGDELLVATATEFKGLPNAKGYRVGGDEFNTVQKMSATNSESQVRQLRQDFRNNAYFPNSDLPPNINCGTASLIEAVEIFYRLMPDQQDRQAFIEREGRGEGLNYVADLLKNVADMRATIQKNIERLNLMVELKIKEKELLKARRRKKPFVPLSEADQIYTRNLKWIRKGMGRFSESTLDVLVDTKQNDPENYEDTFNTLVSGELEGIAQRDDDKIDSKTKILLSEIALRPYQAVMPTGK